MKKLLLVFATTLYGFGALAQTDTSKKHVPYLSIGLNFAPKTTNSTSIEGGTWGITSNTTFGVTYDFVPSNYTNSNGVMKNYLAQWLGAKAYWTTHSETKLCYMVYVAPKICVNTKPGMNKELIEFGFNPYYNISKKLLFGVCIGNQILGNDSQWNMFLSGGFTYLFIK